MTYDEFVKALQTLCWVPLNQTDENFKRILPQLITYGENRIYRECDFLATLNATTALLGANVRETVPPSSVIVLRGINVFTPVGAPTNTSTRRILERISPEALDMFWPQASLTPGVPQKYALIGATAVGPPQALSYVVRFMPEPDQAYTAEFTGVIRPASLSPTNTTTLLSLKYSDLLLAACMVMAAGYQRDFGAMAEDPQKALSWEGTYNSLRTGVMLEAARQRGEGADFTSMPDAPLGAQSRSGGAPTGAPG